MSQAKYRRAAISRPRRYPRTWKISSAATRGDRAYPRYNPADDFSCPINGPEFAEPRQRLKWTDVSRPVFYGSQSLLSRQHQEEGRGRKAFLSRMRRWNKSRGGVFHFEGQMTCKRPPMPLYNFDLVNW